MLHSAHKMNKQQNGWFENHEGIPASKQKHTTFLKQKHTTYLKQKQYTPPSPDSPTSQLVFNINRNCYENLPVHQTPNKPYSPYLH